MHSRILTGLLFERQTKWFFIYLLSRHIAVFSLIAMRQAVDCFFATIHQQLLFHNTYQLVVSKWHCNTAVMTTALRHFVTLPKFAHTPMLLL